MGTSPSNTTPSNTAPPTVSDSTEAETHPRPHCRGCMADCPHYTTCNGMPWRKSE